MSSSTDLYYHPQFELAERINNFFLEKIAVIRARLIDDREGLSISSGMKLVKLCWSAKKTLIRFAEKTSIIPYIYYKQKIFERLFYLC